MTLSVVSQASRRFDHVRSFVELIQLPPSATCRLLAAVGPRETVVQVSGTRLWGFFKRRFGTADAWGDKMFVYNYCPLTFMSSSGSNITPDR